MKTQYIFNIIKLGMIVCITLLMISCASRKIIPVKNLEQVREVIAQRNFEIENEWVMPLGGNMITLIGNPNFIRFQNDSVDIYLPFFGERHAGGGYGNVDQGIIYQGPAENFEILEDDRQRFITVNFTGTQRNENLQFQIRFYTNGNANTSVNSSQRNSISYRGFLREIPESVK